MAVLTSSQRRLEPVGLLGASGAVGYRPRRLLGVDVDAIIVTPWISPRDVSHSTWFDTAHRRAFQVDSAELGLTQVDGTVRCHGFRPRCIRLDLRVCSYDRANQGQSGQATNFALPMTSSARTGMARWGVRTSMRPWGGRADPGGPAVMSVFWAVDEWECPPPCRLKSNTRVGAATATPLSRVGCPLRFSPSALVVTQSTSGRSRRVRSRARVVGQAVVHVRWAHRMGDPHDQPAGFERAGCCRIFSVHAPHRGGSHPRHGPVRERNEDQHPPAAGDVIEQRPGRGTVIWNDIRCEILAASRWQPYFPLTSVPCGVYLIPVRSPFWADDECPPRKVEKAIVRPC